MICEFDIWYAGKCCSWTVGPGKWLSFGRVNGNKSDLILMKCRIKRQTAGQVAQFAVHKKIFGTPGQRWKESFYSLPIKIPCKPISLCEDTRIRASFSFCNFDSVLAYDDSGRPGARNFPDWPGKITCSPEPGSIFHRPEFFKHTTDFLHFMGTFFYYLCQRDKDFVRCCVLNVKFSKFETYFHCSQEKYFWKNGHPAMSCQNYNIPWGCSAWLSSKWYDGQKMYKDGASFPQTPKRLIVKIKHIRELNSQFYIHC